MSSHHGSSNFEIFNIDDDTNFNEENPSQQRTEDAPSASQAKSSNPKSDLFKKHFTKLFDAVGNPHKAICNYCKKEYVFKKGSGYGTYQKHLAQHHAQEIGIDRSQMQITGFAGTTSNTSSFRYTDQNNRTELAKMVAVEHLSFNFGEKLGFVKYCQNALNPLAKRMPRTTITRELKKIYKTEKKKLIEIFTNIDNVSICSDIWGDHWQYHHYMGITCHWIDNNWLIQKRVLALRKFDESHTAINIFRLISVILDEYCLTKKIFSIGFDNASANTKSIQDLQILCEPTLGGKFFHIRCACHILNLAVKDGLKTIELYIEPIKTALSFLLSRPSVKKEWARFCINNGRKPKKFQHDVPHRWNSTYDLLYSSANYSTLLCNFFMTYHQEFELHPNHWNVCINMLKVLKTFKSATCVLSGVYYPTSHLFLFEACNIVGILCESLNDPILSDCVVDMMDKWLLYYEKIPPIYLIACIFDPRVKFNGMDTTLKGYYDLINKFYCYTRRNKEIFAQEYINEAKSLCDQLYNEFYSIFSDQFRSTTTGTSSSSSQYTTSTTIDDIPFGKRMLHTLKKQRGGGSTEFDVYLTTTFEFSDDSYEKDFNILEWWKQKSQAYPILSIMVKQFLAVPASTVAVEQLFSASGNILEETRSSLSSESLEVQTLVADWQNAEYRDQEIQISEDLDTTDASTMSCGSSNANTDVEQDDDDDLD